MATIALLILGLVLTPLLKVKLLPDRALPSITIFYNYLGANAVVADNEVTSKLGSIFPKLAGKLNNKTGQHKKAVALARQILSKEIKVPSQAIKEIRKEMREILSEIQTSANLTNKHLIIKKNHIKSSPMLIKRQFW